MSNWEQEVRSVENQRNEAIKALALKIRSEVVIHGWSATLPWLESQLEKLWDKAIDVGHVDDGL